MWGRHRDPLETRIAALRKYSAAARQQAVEALGESQDSRAMQPLSRMLRDSDDQVRRAAVKALSRFGAEAVDLLMRGLEDENLIFQENALKVLHTIHDERAIPVVIDLLGTPDYDLRRQAAALLKSFGQAAIPALWNALDHVQDSVRSAALEILAAMPEQEAAARLLNALEHPSSYVREKAADLFLHQGERALESLSQLLNEHNALAASTVLEILARLGDAQSLPILEKALAYPQWQIREHAITVLGHLRSPGAAALLARSLADPEQYIRQRAVEMLGQQEGSLAVAPLMAALADPVPEIRRQALWSLGEFGDVQAVESILAFWNHPHDALRQEAAAALRKIRDVRAIPAFQALSAAEQAGTREQADALLIPLFAMIETLVFGVITTNLPDLRTTVWNLETADLTMVMPALTTVIIQPDTADFYQVERFLTYALNFLGSGYLKHHVAVHLDGHPYTLHPNLRNNLEHLFGRVVMREGGVMA